MATDRILSRSFVVLVLGAFSFFMSLWLVVTLLPAYVLEINGSEADIGLVLGIFAFTALLSRPIVGRMVDRFGCKVVALAGCIVFATAPILYTFASSVTTLLLLRMFHGLGIALFGTAGTTWVANLVPPGRRAQAMGVYTNSSQVAIAIAPLVGATIHAAGGFLPLFAIASTIGIAGVILVGTVHEDRLPDSHILPGGGFRQALGRGDVLAMSLAVTTAAATWGILVSFLPVYVAERSAGQSALFFTFYAIVTIGLRLIIGPMADRLGRRIMIAPAMLCLAVVMVLFTTLSSATYLYVLAVMYAASFGTIYPTLSAFLVDVVPANVRGSAIGVFTAGFDLGVAIGSYGGGLVAQWLGLGAAFAAAGVFCLIGVIVFLTGTKEGAQNSGHGALAHP